MCHIKHCLLIFSARDFYHDLDSGDARKWLYFDKFKMVLHYHAVSQTSSAPDPSTTAIITSSTEGITCAGISNTRIDLF